mmetsp:Transcript_19017/g.31547  ORF Transcript_19017/g.31547 Transcript_19017/m.31547 type:complete len:238 (+) Transcript_19017:83-796(+)
MQSHRLASAAQLTAHVVKTDYLELEGTRKASNKGEESKDGDEKKLEVVGIKTKGEFFGDNVVTNGGGIGLALGRSGKEGWDGLALLTLEVGETIIDNVVLLGSETGGGSSSVKGWVTGDLESRVGEISNLELLGWTLVSSSRDVGEWLPGLGGGSEAWVSTRIGGNSSRGSLLRGSLLDNLLDWGLLDDLLDWSLLGNRLLSDSTGGHRGEGLGRGQQTSKGNDGERLHLEFDLELK